VADERERERDEDRIAGLERKRAEEEKGEAAAERYRV
jgi:hypothetical protein